MTSRRSPRPLVLGFLASALWWGGCRSSPEPREEPVKRRTAPPLRQAPPAPAPAPAPTKRELSQAEIHRAIGTRKEQFWRCLKVHKDPGLYKLKFQILPDGTVSRASPVRVPTRKEDPRPYTDLPAEVDGGKDPRSPTSACLVRWIRTVTFPRFDGWPIDSQYPLLLWER